MIVGCYSIDLYCDNKESKTCLDTKNIWFGAQYTEYIESRCLKKAKADGWVIKNKNDEGIREVYCPLCKKKR